MSKREKILLLIIVILLICVLILGRQVLLSKKMSKCITRDETTEKFANENRYIYVKIGPLLKVTYEEKYKLCDGKICGDITETIEKVELLNDSARNIYSDVNVEGMELHEGIAKLISTLKDKGISNSDVKLYYDSGNFDSSKINVDSNITIYNEQTTNVNLEELQMEPTYYSVTFDNDGEVTVIKVEDGKNVLEIPSVEKTGYVFVEWQLDNQTFDFSTPITGDITLNAVWTKDVGNKYTITFDSDGGSIVKEQLVLENNVVKKPTNPTKDGFIFVEWQLDGSTYNFKTKVTGDMTLKAIWREFIPVEITYDTDGGTNIAKQTIEKDTVLKKPTNPTKAGYRFVEWQLDGKAYNFSNQVTEDITLKAVWIQTFTVIFVSNGGSSVATQTIDVGNRVSKPSNPTKNGYTFVEWQVGGETYDFSKPVNSNLALAAVWKKDEVPKYTVTFNSDGGSNVNSQTIEKGKTVTKPSNPTKNGYTFVEWQLNGKTYNFSNQVTGNITLKAVWKEIVYTVKITKVDEYSPDRVLSVYKDGTKISFKTIKYTDGTELCSGNNPTVSATDIEGETAFKVVLNDNTEINARVS